MKLLHFLFIVGFCHAILAENSCIYEHPTYGVINLTPVALRTGQPRFRDVSTSPGSYYTYSFNPCFSFTENSCQNAAVCQVSSNRQYSYTLAVHNSSLWSMDANMQPTLTYTYGYKSVSITMICSNSIPDVLEVVGEDYSNHYSMRLRSRCACWNRCASPTPDTSTITSSTSPAPTTRVIYYSACLYHDSRYGTIDLSSIGDVSGQAAFKDLHSTYSDNYLWSYNPCYAFSEYSCQKVAGCQIDRTRGVSYTIGLQEYAYWTNMNSTGNLLPSIVYPSMTTNRRLSVQLVCERSMSTHRLQVLGETSVGEYVMQLTSPCACWDGCVKPAPSPSPMQWNFWMILGIASCVVFILFCTMMTCLFCSKPKRRYPVFIINEKTPFLKGTM